MRDQKIKEKRNEESTWRRDKSSRHERRKFWLPSLSLATRNEGRKEGVKEWLHAYTPIVAWQATAPSICVHALWRCKLQLNYRFLPSFLFCVCVSLLLLLLLLYSHGSCALAYRLPSSCIISFLPFHFFGKHSEKSLSVFISLNLEGTIYSWISLLRKKTVLVATTP